MTAPLGAHCAGVGTDCFGPLERDTSVSGLPLWRCGWHKRRKDHISNIVDIRLKYWGEV